MLKSYVRNLNEVDYTFDYTFPYMKFTTTYISANDYILNVLKEHSGSS